ncbi:U-box domain-containing protein [Mycena indigotica]|uniref:RING-type E3 ubiquitin transferase n=1 Tax=Mycena indigotica TaxID=2126181 RepID=A0A8H6W278_9AGAR|nr:U-box domain-containing protein [Mycena indigotica]KAF7298968.1 U-box domain-containing protein [Mycena indigotica]
MSEPTPQDDAERIRLKRLAKLQNATPSTSQTPPAPATPPQQPPPQPKRTLPVFKPTLPPAATSPVLPAKKKAPAIVPLDVDVWEHETIGRVFNVTLDSKVAQDSGYEIVWLKPLAIELETENSTPLRLTTDIIDRLLIARLEMDPGNMSDDLDFLPVLASLPAQQTIFEYLVGCWKRSNASRSALMKKTYAPLDLQNALRRLDKIHELIISYTGLTLQEPEMFPQPSGRLLGPPELVTPLLSLSALSAPLMSSSSSSPNSLAPSDIGGFLQDLARRFEPDNEIDGILGPVVTQLLFHESLSRPEGLLGGDSGWRGVIGGLDALVSVKSIASMITRLEDWNPPNATAATIEHISLMGPLCRLGVFGREWPSVAQAYFTDPEKRSRDDVNSSFASLRGSMKSLQSALFRIFNIIVRASTESREAVLDYFARVISLNVKRAGMQVEPDSVATDSFVVNMQSVLLCFAENFIDARYEKMDRIDPLFYARSPRIDLKEETRIKATSEEAAAWAEAQQDTTAAAPNFVSNIFYLTIAMSHYGILHTISTYNDFGKHLEELQRHLDMINADTSWQGTPFQAQGEAAVTRVKTEIAKIRMQQLSYEAQLLDPELVFRSITFTNFLSTWLIRQAEPNQRHPNPPVQLPLPQEVPMAFRVLPEYIVEDIVDYLHFVVQYSPDKFELSGKIELMTFVLTFLNSTWYIKNPFLKSKINDVLFFSIWNYGRERHGLLGGLLNTNEMALKHLMPALTHFYIEVEQTGASSQFYDKFSARRNISYILKVVWDNPTHRAALNAEAAQNVDKFVKFVNLMINDVTYLMDESLSDLAQIHTIQRERDDGATWNAQPQQQRRERENTLRTLERHASGYISLGRSTVELLKVFTSETKGPFMMPEIVNRLAAMLDYNLQALVGPKYGDLAVRDKEKLKFDPRALLSDIIQVFLNLSDREEFVDAVASDGRSYSAELFEQAATIAVRRSLKTEGEIAQLRAFIARVEERKATMEAEEDFDDIPEEFQDPLMYHLMRDPVLLPTSRTIIDRSTIKSHLLSDSKDPFNRQPLSIDQIIPEPELKARIDAWVAEQRKKKQTEATSNVMDTT